MQWCFVTYIINISFCFHLSNHMLCRFLRAVALRHRAVHTGGEPDRYHCQRADDGSIPSELFLLGRLPDGCEHRGIEMPEPCPRPCRMDDTGG